MDSGEPLSQARFLEDIERQRSFCEGKSPLYAKLLAALHENLTAGMRPWFAKLQEAWQGRTFRTYYEGPSLLLAQLHYQALAGSDERLKAIFPTRVQNYPMSSHPNPLPDGERETREVPTSGGAARNAESVIINYLNSAPQDFWGELKNARLQTNEPGRAVGWLLVACIGFCLRRTPFHLVDMGTSGGLVLIGDYLPRIWDLKNEDGQPATAPEFWTDIPYPVLSRTGLDTSPRNLADRKDRLWLKACIWPDDAERHARFDEAARLFLRLALDLSGPKLERSEFADMPGLVASKIKPHPEEGLLLFNSQAADFISDPEYKKLKDAVAKTLEPWEDRAFWAELELPRGQSAGFHQLTVHRLKKGKLESKVLATMTAHPKEVRLKSGWNFLAPLKPVRPPRNTREEPPKNLEPGRYRFP